MASMPYCSGLIVFCGEGSLLRAFQERGASSQWLNGFYTRQHVDELTMLAGLRITKYCDQLLQAWKGQEGC